MSATGALRIGSPLRRAHRLLAISVLLLFALPTASAAAAPPVVIAEAATEVGFSAARAHGIVTPGTQEAFYRFDYIADSAYRRNAAEGKELFAGASSDGLGWLPASSTPVPVAPLLGESGDIEAGVEYHLRLVAESAEGTVSAQAPTFLTPKPLEPIPCTGDNCQVLPPEPRDPTLGTTVAGLGNPKVHYSHYGAKAKGKPHKKHKKHRRTKKKTKTKQRTPRETR